MNCPDPPPRRKMKLPGNMSCLGEARGGMSLWERLRNPFAKKREPVPAAESSAAERAPSEGIRPAEVRLAALTQREREVFRLLVEGYTLRETAQQLGLKYSTVNTHMTGIYRKLGVNSRAELIIRYRDYDKEDSE